MIGAGATLVARQGIPAIVLTSQLLHAVENGFKPAQLNESVNNNQAIFPFMNSLSLTHSFGNIYLAPVE